MNTINAVVRNGRIEVADPIDLPDGTELTIPLPDRSGALGVCNEDSLDSPEAIEAWIRWYDALEPLVFEETERAAWSAARQDQKNFELAQWNERSQRLESRFR